MCLSIFIKLLWSCWSLKNFTYFSDALYRWRGSTKLSACFQYKRWLESPCGRDISVTRWLPQFLHKNCPLESYLWWKWYWRWGRWRCFWPSIDSATPLTLSLRSIEWVWSDFQSGRLLHRCFSLNFFYRQPKW